MSRPPFTQNRRVKHDKVTTVLKTKRITLSENKIKNIPSVKKTAERYTFCKNLVNKSKIKKILHIFCKMKYIDLSIKSLSKLILHWVVILQLSYLTCVVCITLTEANVCYHDSHVVEYSVRNSTHFYLHVA